MILILLSPAHIASPLTRTAEIKLLDFPTWLLLWLKAVFFRIQNRPVSALVRNIAPGWATNAARAAGAQRAITERKGGAMLPAARGGTPERLLLRNKRHSLFETQTLSLLILRKRWKTGNERPWSRDGNQKGISDTPSKEIRECQEATKIPGSPLSQRSNGRICAYYKPMSRCPLPRVLLNRSFEP